MNITSLGQEYLLELEMEVPATRKCLERILERLYAWKPHEKSMNIGYLALLVADIPNWITWSIEKSEIDLAKYPRFDAKTTADLVKYFDKNIEGVRNALTTVTNERLSETFSLKNNGQLLFSASQKDNLVSCINHWVHHRGQLTVYMRLNDIAVPSIYGPSADEKTF